MDAESKAIWSEFRAWSDRVVATIRDCDRAFHHDIPQRLKAIRMGTQLPEARANRSLGMAGAAVLGASLAAVVVAPAAIVWSKRRQQQKAWAHRVSAEADQSGQRQL